MNKNAGRQEQQRSYIEWAKMEGFAKHAFAKMDGALGRGIKMCIEHYKNGIFSQPFADIELTSMIFVPDVRDSALRMLGVFFDSLVSFESALRSKDFASASEFYSILLDVFGAYKDFLNEHITFEMDCAREMESNPGNRWERSPCICRNINVGRAPYFDKMNYFSSRAEQSLVRIKCL